MHKNIFLLVMVYILLLTLGAVHAGEIIFTGKATIAKNDIRSAQNASLKNALLGGIRKYLREVAHGKDVDVTEDYFMFVESYTIIDRQLDNNNIITTVQITINDLITEDVAVYAIQQPSVAVFLISGLPEYIQENDLRKMVMSIFASKQFSTKEQIAFEQELIDQENRSDILTAFQSVSAAQYLFEFTFNLTQYKAGQSCTLISDSTYISANNLSQTVPILRTEITEENGNTVQCILLAVESSIDAALTHVREKLLPTPGQPMELQKFNVVFTGVSELKTINTIVDTLTKRKTLHSAYMEEFSNDEAIFAVESYFSPKDLAEQIRKLQFDTIAAISHGPESVKLKVR